MTALHPPQLVVHVLRYGVSLCNLAGLPSAWPLGHRWVTEEASRRTPPSCAGCRQALSLEEMRACWLCYVCKQWRPDAVIKVIRHPFVWPGGVRGQENVRYCADVPACFQGALAFSLFPPGFAERHGIVFGDPAS